MKQCLCQLLHFQIVWQNLSRPIPTAGSHAAHHVDHRQPRQQDALNSQDDQMDRVHAIRGKDCRLQLDRRAWKQQAEEMMSLPTTPSMHLC
jgi:hypothetical protein